MVKKEKVILTILAAAASLLLAGCNIKKQDDSLVIENGRYEVQIHSLPKWEDGSLVYEGAPFISFDRKSDESSDDQETLPDDKETLPDDDTEFSDTYEYYLSKEELIADIEEGYIFRMDKTFREPAIPIVTGGNWFFYVNEDNLVNLEIEFSNLYTEPKNRSVLTGLFSPAKEIKVELISPDKETVYSFEKSGNEITADTSVQEQLAVTPGEWNLKISFSYVSRGGDTPANLKISAAYEAPSVEDIQWLMNERLKN